ncbi:unnamed protein product, partial [Oppiella nova]
PTAPDVSYGTPIFLRLPELLLNHKKSDNHVSGEPYRCGHKECDYMTPLKEDLLQHMSDRYSHRMDEPIVDTKSVGYVCDWIGCRKSFTNEYVLKGHKRSHNYCEDFRCDWEGCAQVFGCARGLRAHTLRVHDNTYRCNLDGCQHATEVEESDVSHESNDKIIDETDEELRERPDSRGSHKTLNETIAKKTQLNAKCGQYSRDYRDCAKTVDTIGLKTPIGHRFFCDHPNCSKHFRQISYLEAHKTHNRHVLGQPYRCGHLRCDYRTPSKEDLVNHMTDGCVMKSPALDSDSQRHDSRGSVETLNETIAKKKVVIKSEDDHNNGSSDEEMCETSQDIQLIEEVFVCSLNGCEFSSPAFGLKLAVVDQHHSYRHTTPFKCTQCGQTFPTNFALKHHFQRNHNKELVKVLTRRSTCGKSTINKSRPKRQTSEPTVVSQDVNTTEKSINSNEVKIVSIVSQNDSRLQTSEGLHVCGYNGCGKSYPTLRQLSQHKRMHPLVNQMTTDGRYVCGHSGCGKSFAKLVYLTKHKYTHEDKIYRCDVDGCSARFSSPNYVTDHKMYKHNTKYRCDWEGCDYKTGSKYIFDKHQLIAHSGERQFTCPAEECLQTFKTKSDVTHHQRRRHPDSVPDVPWIQCTHTDCQFRTKSNLTLKAHLKQHTKHYRCDQCSKWFTHLSQLKLHEPIHNEALQYPCEWPGCERRFPRKGHLALHMAAHEGEKKYRCSWPGCSKKYNVKHMLKSHEITHKDPTKYRCHWPGCGRLLSSKKSLTRHESEHTASRRYRCHWPGQSSVDNVLMEVMAIMTTKRVLISSLNPTRSDDQRNEESIGDQDVVIKSEDNHNNGSSDEEMCETSQDIHSTEGLFVCSVNDCQYSCQLKAGFTQHQLIRHPDAFPDILWIECSHTGCQYRCKDKNNMNAHLIRHVKPFECSQCGQTFAQNYGLIWHTRKRHTLPVRVGARGIGRTRVTKSRHKLQTVVSQDIQLTEGLFVCSLNGCRNTFEFKQHYIRHQLVVHPDAFPHKPWLECPHTGCVFRTKHNHTMKLHSFIHTKPFVCTRCGQTFTSNIALKKHSKSCHPISQTNKQTVGSREAPTEGSFVCSLNGCDFSCQRKPDLNRHQLVVHPGAFPDIPWIQCPHTGCKFSIKHTGTMTQHSYRHTKPFECTRCGQTFTSKSALKNHSTRQNCHPKWQTNEQTVGSQDVNTNEKSINSNELKSDSNDSQSVSRLQISERLHVCYYNGYGKSFPNSCELRSHRPTHVTVIPNKINGLYVCDYIGCGKSWPMLSRLTEHKYIHSAKSFRCDVDGCTAMFSSPIYLKGHKTRRHSTKYRCDWEGCDFKTGEKYHLNKHQLIVHSGERRFTCPVEECRQKFKTKHDMNVHQLTQHPDSVPDVPWIQCTHTDCKYTTKSNWALKAHIKQHSKHYRCDECGKWFTHLSQLKGHVPTHSDVLNYRCEWPGCEKRFAIKGAMTNHMNTHTGEHKYRCSWPGCGKKFRGKTKLIEHEVLHKDPMKYQCHWPGFLFCFVLFIE